MKLKIINTSRNPLPAYETPGSAGMDIRAANEEDIILCPGETVKVPTGLFIELENGFEAQIRSRSGLTFNSGIVVANGVGTIDSDYRGEIGVLLHNISREKYTVHYGERIAQMVFARYERAEVVECCEIGQTSRGEGGFGHTGV